MPRGGDFVPVLVLFLHFVYNSRTHAQWTIFPLGPGRSSPPFVILQPEVRHGAPCLLSVRSGAAGVRHLPYLPPVRPAAGICHFALYAIRKGFSLPEVLGMSAQGVRAAKNILTTFVLIGILTSLWRAGGTIPAIVCYSVRVMEPRLFLVCSFLLNCLVSFLTGTAFGSAATMGAVCMTMAAALGADPLMTGGAILSGVYFGDRCSPVSTSALLVARPHRDRPVWEHPADAADQPGPLRPRRRAVSALRPVFPRRRSGGGHRPPLRPGVPSGSPPPHPGGSDFGALRPAGAGEGSHAGQHRRCRGALPRLSGRPPP